MAPMTMRSACVPWTVRLARAMRSSNVVPDDTSTPPSLEDAFRVALAPEARPRFADDATLAGTLAQLRTAALAAYPDLDVEAAIRAQLSVRLGVPAEEVDSIVRLMQSGIQVSLERLLP
jgi:hypothetical protein